MQYHGTVRNGVVVLAQGERLPEGTAVTVMPSAETPREGKQKRTSLAEWAERHAESWQTRISSDDVDSFTGRDL